MTEDIDILNLFTSEDNRQDTSELQFYNTFEEKKSVFGIYQRFDSSTLFMNFVNNELPALLGGKKAVYRGLGQARYRLFNKAQRSYANNEANGPKDNGNYHRAIAELITNAISVNNRVLAEFFKATGLRNSHIAVLSFLQHYGAPTPFMDWTSDIFVALFFAIMEMTDEEIDKYHTQACDYKIVDYFSLILIIEDSTLDQITAFKQLKATNIGSVNYEALRRKKFQFIREIYKAGRPTFSLLNNLHIINQKGLFIYNNSSWLPLEEVFFKEWKGYYIGNTILNRQTPRTPVICIDVHKSIAFHIRRQLKKMGYNSKMIFSKPEDIAKQAIPKILLKGR